MAFVTPPPLASGDRVAVVAPSSGGARSAPHVLSLALDRLRDRFDLDPVVHPTARQGDDFLAAHPRGRAAAVHEAFRDPEIRAVFATIGGDDQLRVLRYLDPAVLREHPTRFFGMSDNTNLNLYLWREGVVSYNGGQLLNQVGTPGRFPAFSERYLRRALFEESLGDLDSAPRWTDDTVEWADPDYAETTPEYEPAPDWTWAGGDERVEGRVWGGCLAIVDWHLASDRYLPALERLDGQVLAIETAEDLPSAAEVRWSLMCMGERGLLERFDAVLVGRPQTRNRFERPSRETRERFRRDQREAVLSQLARYNPEAPVVFDLDFGHTNPTVPLPVGGRVDVDPNEGTIRFT
ncbi:S66 family peptidase [Halomarina oriensis]|uniref:LD-carboxypeptidase n=1 Tax=Halomarina oriensis TaxID=671145 RepID=A0A6B0GJY9_9EURY|nr:S66 peptidase family protein [Halomarina oriensis]MWG34181.1 LD-carboxypeptidase [Halomarina oriensis]